MSAAMAIKWPRPKALKIRSIIEKMGICACGTNAHWECVKELLEGAIEHKDRGFYRDNWFEFGAKVLDSWGLLEHGTGIGYAWLTGDGRLLLEFLQDFGLDDHCMDTGAGHPMWAVEFSWGEEAEDGDTYWEWEQGL